ncbi:hypothetical protein ACEUZ9_004621 [Paracoccus litorisediminis]|uniref:hypothetical protein n=1 Tax=Paracoccus litorisediminis TaxID=2006130 RepID=UPI00372EB439
MDAGRTLSLFAAPVFALMAGVSATAPGMAICATPLLPVNDMALMYLLMGVFHLPPWLRLRRTTFTNQTDGG